MVPQQVHLVPFSIACLLPKGVGRLLFQLSQALVSFLPVIVNCS